VLKPPIVHGDLKGDNVLIDHNGIARLADFGLSRMLQEVDITLWNTSAVSGTPAPGTLRWSAPELLLGKQTTVTIQSDIYAYGMTCYEVYTGLAPFHDYHGQFLVLKAILDGEVPQRIPGSDRFTDKTWDLCTQCWDRDPQARPTSSAVLAFLLN